MQSQQKRWVQPEMDATSDIFAGRSRQMGQTKSAGGGESGSSPAVLPPATAAAQEEAGGFPSSSSLTGGSAFFDRLVSLNGVRRGPSPIALAASAAAIRADLRDCCDSRAMATAASRAARRVDLLVVAARAGLRTTGGEDPPAVEPSSSRAWRWSAAALALRVTRADMDPFFLSLVFWKTPCLFAADLKLFPMLFGDDVHPFVRVLRGRIQRTVTRGKTTTSREQAPSDERPANAKTRPDRPAIDGVRLRRRSSTVGVAVSPVVPRLFPVSFGVLSLCRCCSLFLFLCGLLK
mmetsp:Transcript_29022/g.65530  ORF Transcript_29022/g.65530 Transcript_29022/m.65530 type:complete len:292 (-) Transcript_29022:137-1012(-)